MYDVNFTNPNLWPSPDVTAASVDYAHVCRLRLNTYDPCSSNLLLHSEYAYPSDFSNPYGKQYFWSAICRRTDIATNLQVTVFVSRKVGTGLTYYRLDSTDGLLNWSSLLWWSYTLPVKIPVTQDADCARDEIKISDADIRERNLINEDYTIVEDSTGRIYKVLERYSPGTATVGDYDRWLKLDKPWQGPDMARVWVIPPPMRPDGYPAGRYPCIAVYQKVMQF